MNVNAFSIGSKFTSVGELWTALLKLVNWLRALRMVMMRERKTPTDVRNERVCIVTHRSVALCVRQWRPWWLRSARARVACLSLLLAGSIAAQTQRGSEIIESALAAQPDERHGAALYRKLCSSCHGRKAHGRAAPVTPALAGQLEIYLIKQIVDLAEGDRNEPEMHRVVARKELSTPQAIRDVSTHLSKLPVNPQPEVGDGKDLAVGRRFYDGLCAFCHGTTGEGNVLHATPALQRQHYSYLLMQSRRLAIGHRYSVPIEVIEILEQLPFDKLTAVSDYASRLPEQATLTPPPEPIEDEAAASDP